MEVKDIVTMYEIEDEHFWFKAMRKTSKELFKQTLPKKRGNIILDAGCGTGANIEFLKQYGFTYGFDLSKEGVDLCKKRGLKNVKVGTVTDIKFKNNFFDIVTCFDVLGQIEVKSEKKAIAEFYRVLKPGGIVMVRIAAYNWLKGYHDKSIHTKYRFTLDELEKLLEKNGFKILRSTYGNTFLFPLVLLRRFVLNRITPEKKVRTSDVGHMNPFINKIFFLIMSMESFFIKFFSLPFGLSVIAVAQKPQ